jgi:molecular chaperone GrpE
MSDTVNTYNLIKPIEEEMILNKQRISAKDRSMVQKLKKELEETKWSLKEYKDLYVRQLAEMENYSRAKEREIAQITRNASRDVIKSLLPLLDTIDAAIQKSGNSTELAVVRDQLTKILGSYGFSSIDAKDKKFDPYLHEAIAIVQSDKDGIVIDEVQKGYKLNNEVLRTSKVVVGKKGE